MTEARFAGQGQNSGRAGRGPGNGRGQGRGRGTGYTSKPKTSKVRLCKELENNIFDYGLPNAANSMRTTQEKIGQYVGIKYGEDIANELTNKATVTIRRSRESSQRRRVSSGPGGALQPHRFREA
jgi:hypothetical protein